ncbi:MAG: acyl-CoA dehydrogenase family protein [Pseudomonadota bacterium]
MSDDLTLIADATARILADLADPQAVNAAPDQSWRAPLWQALEEAGLTRAWVPEAQGGAGVPLSHGFEILRVSGHYACPVALAETMLAGWCLSEAGLDVPSGVLAIAPMRGHDRLSVDDAGALSGIARAVPFAAEAAQIIVVAEGQVMRFEPGSVTASPRRADMGGERVDLRFESVVPAHVAAWPGGAAALERMGAVARACQMTGALETALHVTTGYTQEREAFGRKIAKFQAVQQNLARLAGEVAAALSASGSAAETLETEPQDSDAAFLEIAAAKIRCGEAVETGAAIAHQAHGAIGWTQDYVLQRFTRRLWGWRDDFGTEADWAVRLGRHVAALGGDALWPLMTSR